MSEDCLYLNVYTPYPIPAEPVPIMIFFYGAVTRFPSPIRRLRLDPPRWTGGSWDIGSGSFLLYDPDADISLVEDVIVVTVNYRLNVFGFLASNALRSQVSSLLAVLPWFINHFMYFNVCGQDPDGSTGNYGLQASV
jgi:hypothetical protein